EEFRQGAARRWIGDAIDAFRAEVALESGHDLACYGVVVAAHFQAVAIISQRFLQRDDWIAARPESQDLAKVHDRRGLNPMPNAGFMKRAPREFFSRILLARRRNIRMGQDTHRCDHVTGLDAAAEG